MATIAEALALAVRHHGAGDLAQAESLYRQVLQVEPGHQTALCHLGLLACQVGRPDVGLQYLGQARAAGAVDAPFSCNLGWALQLLGRLDEAAACYREGLRLDPRLTQLHVNLGIVLVLQGRLDEASASFRQAVGLDPENAAAHYNLAGVLQAQGRLAEAIACYRRTVQLQPDHAEAHNNLGNALYDQGQWGEALVCYRQALRLKPDHAAAHNNLGNALRVEGRYAEAVACYQRALQLSPDLAEAHNNLGNALVDLGRSAEAITSYERALHLKPDIAEFHNSLATALRGQGRSAEAIAAYRTALRLRPAFVDALLNLGVALFGMGELEEAEACFRQALALQPDSLKAENNLGTIYRMQCRLDEALASYERALALDPGCAEVRINRGLVWLMRGEFARGWPDYDWRRRAAGLAPRSFPQPMWDGTPLGGRSVLLHAEQGLGDTIHFIRYAPLVRQLGGRVFVEVQGALANLLAPCQGIDRIVRQGEPLPPFDVQVPFLSLPGVLGTTLATIPNEVPYLFADPSLAARWRSELGRSRALRVGIAWQGNPTNAHDWVRSIPLSCFAPLARVAGVRLLSLQKGPGTDQVSAAAKLFPMTDLGSELDETTGAFMDTAAVMKDLDLVITSDTATAHLAGALGVPAWVVVACAPDWRWLLDREDSPWYPSARLFRQAKPGSWDEVFARIAGELAKVSARMA